MMEIQVELCKNPIYLHKTLYVCEHQTDWYIFAGVHTDRLFSK